MFDNLHLQKVTFPISGDLRIKGIDHKKKDKQGGQFKRHLDKEQGDEQKSGDSDKTENHLDHPVRVNIDNMNDMNKKQKNRTASSKADKDGTPAIDIIV